MNKICIQDIEVLIDNNQDIVEFGNSEDAVDQSWILKAEKVLGVKFTTSYLWVLKKYCGGEICGVVNLDGSSVTKEQLGNVIGRLRGYGNNTVQEVIFVKNNQVFHQALAFEAENILGRSLKP